MIQTNIYGFSFSRFRSDSSQRSAIRSVPLHAAILSLDSEVHLLLRNSLHWGRRVNAILVDRVDQSRGPPMGGVWNAPKLGETAAAMPSKAVGVLRAVGAVDSADTSGLGGGAGPLKGADVNVAGDRVVVLYRNRR